MGVAAGHGGLARARIALGTQLAPYARQMGLRLDNIGIVVEDLTAAIEFFRELGLELEGPARSRVSGQGASPAWATNASRSP